MEKITLHNYEAWLLDHSEGMLSEAQKDALYKFAAAHPELSIDLDGPGLPKLEKEEVDSGLREFLRHDVDEEELLGYIEGQLNEKSRNAFEDRLASDAGLAARLDNYRRTILQKDFSETFGNKQLLKKPTDEELLADPLLNKLESLIDGYALDLTSQSSSYEWKLLQLTRLKSDQVFYPDKEALKKRSRVILLFSPRVLRVAAAIVLFCALSVIVGYYFRPEPAQVANRPVVQEQSLPVPTATTPSKNTGITQPEKKLTQTERRVEKQVVLNNTEIPVALEEKVKEGEPESEEKLSVSESTTYPALAEKGAVNEVQDVALSVPTEEKSLTRITEVPLMEEENEARPSRNTIWQRLASLAGEANKFGLNAVDGKSQGEDGFKLSLLAYSVEKH
jgi:hypothetical protein